MAQMPVALKSAQTPSPADAKRVAGPPPAGYFATGGTVIGGRWRRAAETGATDRSGDSVGRGVCVCPGLSVRSI